MKNELKIAKYIYSKYFLNKKQNEFVYLFNDLQNCYLQYIIKKENDIDYIVQKLKSPKTIATENEITQSDAIELIMDYYDSLYDSNLIEFSKKMNIQQMYQFFVVQQNMRVNDFNQFFESQLYINVNRIQKQNYTIDFQDQFTQEDINKIQSLIQFYFGKFPKFRNFKIYLYCRNTIINHDQTITNGNTVNNINGYDINIQLDKNENLLYVLSHEFGHNFEDLYCDCKYVDELFEINKNKHFFKHPQTLFNQRLQFIPQLFAQYYIGKMDQNTKNNFQKLILEKIK